MDTAESRRQSSHDMNAFNAFHPMNKPFEIVGARELTATVWKAGDADSGWEYRFKLYRQCRESGLVSQLFRPSDVSDLVKLCRVLAVTLADDGCLPSTERQALAELGARLDLVTRVGE